ncbi:hypothetical protein [Kitasatospora aureofaciens]|uniref:hypothetical protein n=1 Tax=Kitasatospora aureofaciens TaxID=1894 RepID=UPI001C46016A|nr:hypothetical protein [Kitasatospora aureofaciens]MBV6700917.1 hypothetical protein [Kitasatospora aureofaciens]
MRRVLRGFAVLAAVTALIAPAASSTGAAAAPAPAPAPTSSTRATKDIGFPGVYISPWGSAHVRVSDETKQWLQAEGATLGAIAPFTLDPDGYGFDMPIGSTPGDHLDSKGRIYYPGGITINHPASGHTFTLIPTYIRVMPTPIYSAGVLVDGQRAKDEVTVADSTYGEVIAGARPSATGFRLEKIPFRITQQTSDLITQYIGRPGPAAGTYFGTLTPNFDYVPTH